MKSVHSAISILQYTLHAEHRDRANGYRQQQWMLWDLELWRCRTAVQEEQRMAELLGEVKA